MVIDGVIVEGKAKVMELSILGMEYLKWLAGSC